VQNQALIQQDSVRQSYVDNYLTPLVNALKGHPGLYAWEIFNEPEGMLSTGWAAHKGISETDIQKTINWFAAAIHTADPNALVTSGAQTFDYCSNVAGKHNYYSDAALQAAGGKPNGTLDFYEVHYYSQNGASNSPFLNTASHWGLDKKVVVGEFAAVPTDGVVVNDLFKQIFSGGYAGGWAWSYTEGNATWAWPAMQAPMAVLYAAQTTTVDACP
jgi:hypothetical protein